MKRKLLILFLTCVVGWLSPLNAQTIDLNKQYRVRVYSGNSTGMYLHINTTNEPTRATQVGVASQQESNNQIFTVEEVGDGNYYLKTADGYYIRCNNNDYTNYNDNDTYNNGLGNWGVAAYSTTDKSPLTFEYSGEVFYIKDANKTSTNNYFKIQSSLVYCDAASGLDDPYGNGYVCTWFLEEYVAPTLSAVSISAEKSSIYTDETVSITATTTGGTTPFTYNWSATSGSIDGNGQTVTFNPSSVGTSYISCSVTDAKSVTVVSNTVEVEVLNAADKPKEVEIGSGTTGDGGLPIDRYYKYGLTQQIYTSAEIGLTGTTDITSISFKDLSGTNVTRKIKIWMRNTEEVENETSSKVMQENELCFDGDVTFVANDWTTINFNKKNFAYESGKNILVCVENYSGYYTGISGNAEFEVFDSPTNYSFYTRTDTSPYDATNSAGHAGNSTPYRNHIKLGYEQPEQSPFQLSLSADNTSVCEGDAVELTATVDVDGTYYYTWTVTEGSGEFSNATAATTNFTPSSTGNCVIKCSVYDGTSTVEKTISLTVFDVPELTVSQNTFDIKANGTATIELTYSGTNQPNISDWSVVEDTDATVANKFVVTTKPLKETTELTFKLYNYDSPYDDGVWLCAAEETVTINVEEALFVELGTENDVTSICEDDADGIQLVATPKFAAGDVNYSWTSETEGALDMLSATNIANPVFTPSSIDAVSSTVTYTCTVEDDGGTTSSDEITLTVYDMPELNISEYVIVNSGEKLIIPCDSKNYTFNINVEPYVEGTTYEYPNETDGDYTVWNVIIPVTEDGQFTITANNAFYPECAVSKTINVSVVNSGSTSTTITIGDDVAVDEDGDGWNDNYIECGSSYNNRFPIRSGAEYSVSQQIYTAEELTEKGLGVNDEITSIAFKVSALNDAEARTLDVYLINTDKEGFDSENDYVSISAESNYTGTVTFTDGGWTTINLDTPLKYEGGNVLVCLNDKTNRGTSANYFCLYTTRGEERSIGKSNFAAEFTAPDFTTTSTYVENNENQTYNDLSYNSQIQLTYTKWAGSSDINDASITVDNEEICYYEDNLGDAINYFNFEAAKINGAAYLWDFGDDSEGVGQKVTHNYLNHGKYTVTLTVTQGENTKVVTKEVVVLQKPTAEFTLNHSCYFVGQEMQFIPVETIENSTFELKVWEADGFVGPYDWNYSAYNHELTTDGPATVRYTHENGDDCFGTKEKTVEVYPTPIFSSTNTCNGNATEFSVVLEGISDYNWNFGEGEGFVWDFDDPNDETEGTGITCTHIYTDPDTYNVTLTVYKGDNSYSYSHEVVIYATPTAEFTYEGEYALTDITFTATDAGTQATYAWDFGDPNDETEGTGITCTHQYAEPGEYTVTLTVTQNDCTSTEEQTIIINEKESGAAIEPNYVELGDRPANGWMRPYTINITPDGNTDLTITSLAVKDYYDAEELIVLTHEGLPVIENLPVTLKPGEKFPVEVSTKNVGELDRKINFDITINGVAPTNQTDVNTGNCTFYTAGDSDIYELAVEIDPYSGDEYSPYDDCEPYPNYLLPGVDVETDYYDAVYTFSLEEAAKVTATVDGDNPVVYVYPTGFSGEGAEGGPGLTNYVGYQAPYVPTFEGFSFTLEDDPLFNHPCTQGTGWQTGSEGGSDNMYAELNWEANTYPLPRYFRSYQSNGENELNYFITTDKYYISETARLSMSTWVSASSMKYYVFVSEDGYAFTTVQEGVVNSKTAVTVDVDLSEYVGEYYVGIMHVGAESSGGSGNFYLDDITLYEPETRGTRASADGSLDIMLGVGTYYLVAAAENQDFTVTVSAVELSVPTIATNPSPGDRETNVSTTLEQLEWTFGENTEEYQVLFGTTNPPTDVLVVWNSNIESENGSCALNTLMTNTVYYWQVNVRNIKGENGAAKIWRFATPFDAPQNLALTSTEINLDDEDETSPTLTWDAVAPTTITGYNIWAGNTLLTEEPITGTTYDIDIEDLEFSAEPYKIQVEAIYMVDGLRIASRSSSVELKVNAKASVKGYVYDATTSEPLVGATVTYATEVLTTDANGYYSGDVPAGNYTAVARMSGYNKCEVNVELVPSEYTKDFNLEPTKTMASNVVATERDDKTAVDVKWQFNLEGDPMFENFENGFTYEWTTSAEYPWTVVDITGGPDETVNEDVFGQKCAKSGNYNVSSSESWIELSTFIPFDGKISFYYRISSEPYAGSDIGNFYIDGTQQYIKEYDGDPNNECFGSTLWQDGYREFDVTAGPHIFKWEYKKDYNDLVGNVEDAFYIDNISFYENTNVYNVYRLDILTPKDTTKLAENLTVKELADTDWANEDFKDGIYQWGVSVEYNEPAGDLLNEDFEGVEEPETFLTGWTKYTEEAEDSYVTNNQWHVDETSEYSISACGGTGYSAFVSPLPGESVFYFVTPMLNASRQATLEFDYIIPCYKNVDEDFPNDFSKFKVAYSTSSTGPWTDLISFNKTSVENWTHATVELPLEEELYIAFIDQNVENWGLGIGLDNVRIHRVAVNGTSEIAWSNLIGKGNKLVTNNGDWSSATSWSRTHIPTVDEVAIIKAAGTVNGTGAVAKAVLVDNGTLTIGEGGVLTASTVIDYVAADITINAGGQLVHSNEGVMATFVKGIKAYENVDANTGWYTISSPLAANIDASEVGGLLDGDGDFDLYRYDEPTHYWENYEDNVDSEGPDNDDWDNNSAVIEKGRGYLYANSANTQLSFEGELNVADVTTTLSAQAQKLKGFNLLGNPFAHNIYKGVAFSGSIADAHYTLNYHGEWQVVTPENPIKSGAGFLVQATEGANLTISKTNAQTRAAANSMLAVTVVNNVFEDVAYVSFNDGIGLEKIGHMNEYAPMVYIPGDFNNYAYATVEEDVTEVPVNFEAMTMGEYTIAVKAKNCEYETMILVDNLTGKETNLLKDSYTFMATTTDDPDRFVIKLAKDAEVEDSFIYINNGELIFDNLSNDAIINVFDVLGRNIATFNNCGDTTFRVSTDLFADGVYMVRVIEGNNVKVQKMVIE